ncbi:MAG: carboxymuconolactone decarboxylase family protein [Sphingomonadales bacterium]|nr:carboxymuconolactone decarboxylase family protein [Sphingomonadales bacterium]
MRFPLHDEASAPEASRSALARTRGTFGMIPNLERVMASVPSLLEGYSTLWALFDRTSLTPVERQVVYLTANFENECEYCVPWHTLLAEKAGMAAEVVAALRQGAEVPDERLEALRRFTRALIVNRGKVVEADLQAFVTAGYSDCQALEVVLGLAVKVMSNYTNSIAGTPLDEEVKKLAWRKPQVPVSAGWL